MPGVHPQERDAPPQRVVDARHAEEVVGVAGGPRRALVSCYCFKMRKDVFCVPFTLRSYTTGGSR